MKKVAILFVLLVSLIGCENKADQLQFCLDCFTDTDENLVINQKIGRIVFLDDFNRYAICDIDDSKLVYIPCQNNSMQSYLHSVIEFSGKTIKNSFNIDSLTFYCIQIDSISIGLN